MLNLPPLLLGPLLENMRGLLHPSPGKCSPHLITTQQHQRCWNVRDVLSLSGVGGQGGIYEQSLLLRMKRVVPAPEWDAVLDIKVLKINIFKASQSAFHAIHPTSSRVKQVSNYWSRQKIPCLSFLVSDCVLKCH